jgi:hypothetical protein
MKLYFKSRQLGVHIQKNEFGPLSHTICKNYLKILTEGAKTIKFYEENIGINFGNLRSNKAILVMTSKTKARHSGSRLLL